MPARERGAEGGRRVAAAAAAHKPRSAGVGVRSRSRRSDYLFKLLLIGDSGVGKSCLLLRFAVRGPRPRARFFWSGARGRGQRRRHRTDADEAGLPAGGRAVAQSDGQRACWGAHAGCGASCSPGAGSAACEPPPRGRPARAGRLRVRCGRPGRCRRRCPAGPPSDGPLVGPPSRFRSLPGSLSPARQDDTYTESYISTIGVDFVRGALRSGARGCGCVGAAAPALAHLLRSLDAAAAPRRPHPAAPPTAAPAGGPRVGLPAAAAGRSPRPQLALPSHPSPPFVPSSVAPPENPDGGAGGQDHQAADCASSPTAPRVAPPRSLTLTRCVPRPPRPL